MNPYLDVIKAYLGKDPLRFGEGAPQSLMEMLYWYYTEHHPICGEKIRDGFKALETYFQDMSFQNRDWMFSQISSLCAAHEEAPFRRGSGQGYS